MTLELPDGPERHTLNETARAAATGLARTTITPRILSDAVTALDVIALIGIGSGLSMAAPARPHRRGSAPTS